MKYTKKDLIDLKWKYHTAVDNDWATLYWLEQHPTDVSKVYVCFVETTGSIAKMPYRKAVVLGFLNEGKWVPVNKPKTNAYEIY